VTKLSKALGISLAINLLIVAADLIAAPLHAQNHWQGVLGYFLGATHLLNLPGYTAAEFLSPRLDQHWTIPAFAIALGVNLLFWLFAATLFIRLQHKLQSAIRGSTELAEVNSQSSTKTSTTTSTPPTQTLTRRHLLLRTSRTLATAGLTTAAYSFFAEPRWFEITTQKVQIKNLPPSLSGLRIVQLSDIHHGQWMSIAWVRQIVNATNALNPDIVALTGDYVYRGIEYVGPVTRELARLQPRIGTLAVLGNHDWSDGGGTLTKRLFANEKIPLIDNTRRYITPSRQLVPSSNQGLCIAGVGDLWDDKCDYDQALAYVPGGMPRILLSHNPDVAEEPEFLESGHRVDLMLSGHTHGGQIHIPGLGAPVTNSAYGQKYAKGLVQSPTCPVFISKGLGMTVMPIRLGVRPEIAVIELRKA